MLSGRMRSGAGSGYLPQGIWYLRVTADDVEERIETSIIGDSVVSRLAAGNPEWDKLRNIGTAERNRNR